MLNIAVSVTHSHTIGQTPDDFLNLKLSSNYNSMFPIQM